MRRSILGIALVSTAVITLGAGTASAAQPTTPSCVGESVSANAKALHPYGGFISSVTPRNAFGTLGDAVHAVQAGLVSDELYPNTCN
jgi:Na+/H+-dicarboxylate symporter